MRCRNVAIEARRADLANQIDVPDVDPQFQRRRGDDRLELSILQQLLGLLPAAVRQAAMVSQHLVGPSLSVNWYATRSPASAY